MFNTCDITLWILEGCTQFKNQTITKQNQTITKAKLRIRIRIRNKTYTSLRFSRTHVRERRRSNEERIFLSMKEPTETIYGQVIAKANNYQAVPDKGGKRRIIKTERLRRYESNFVRQCKVYRGRLINYPFALCVVVYFRTAANDLDNAVKTILDCLQYAKAITNDNLCCKVEAEKRIDEQRPRIEYKITPFAADLGELFREKA